MPLSQDACKLQMETKSNKMPDNCCMHKSGALSQDACKQNPNGAKCFKWKPNRTRCQTNAVCTTLVQHTPAIIPHKHTAAVPHDAPHHHSLAVPLRTSRTVSSGTGWGTGCMWGLLRSDHPSGMGPLKVAPFITSFAACAPGTAALPWNKAHAWGQGTSGSKAPLC
eukprot:1161840-Pelagomonas_calceolata.AAC.25